MRSLRIAWMELTEMTNNSANEKYHCSSNNQPIRILLFNIIVNIETSCHRNQSSKRKEWCKQQTMCWHQFRWRPQSIRNIKWRHGDVINSLEERWSAEYHSSNKCCCTNFYRHWWRTADIFLPWFCFISDFSKLSDIHLWLTEMSTQQTVYFWIDRPLSRKRALYIRAL